MKKLRMNHGWASLIGLVIAIGIVCFLFMMYLRPQQQSGRLKSFDQETSGAAKESGIDTSSHLSVLQSSRTKIKAIEDHNKQRGDEMMKGIEAMQQY